MIKKLLLIPIFLLCVIISFAQKRNNSKETISFNQELYGSIKYRLVGPFRGGRAGDEAKTEMEYLSEIIPFFLGFLKSLGILFSLE